MFAWPWPAIFGSFLVKLADAWTTCAPCSTCRATSRSASLARRARSYAPIANRLGIQWMKVELEDLAFRYPRTRRLPGSFGQDGGHPGQRDAYIAEVCQELLRVLALLSVPAQVERGGPKSFWSINQKMKRTGRELEQCRTTSSHSASLLIRCRTATAALGIVHSNWMPVPGPVQKTTSRCPSPMTVVAATGQQVGLGQRDVVFETGPGTGIQFGMHDAERKRSSSAPYQ